MAIQMTVKQAIDDNAYYPLPGMNEPLNFIDELSAAELKDLSRRREEKLQKEKETLRRRLLERMGDSHAQLRAARSA